MTLFTEAQMLNLLTNWIEGQEHHKAGRDWDPKPVVQWFYTGSAFTWLVTELNPDNLDTIFGLGDIGQGYPEIGYNSIKEIRAGAAAAKDPFVMLERDLHWKSDKTLSQYLKIAQQAGRIIA